jgi:transposase
MSNLFRLADEQFDAIECVVPVKRRVVKRRRNRRFISGIIRVLKSRCRRQDCAAEYGPRTTIYNRFNRWSEAGIWTTILERLMVHNAVDIQCVVSITAKAHRRAAGGNGGSGAGHQQGSRRTHSTSMSGAIELGTNGWLHDKRSVRRRDRRIRARWSVGCILQPRRSWSRRQICPAARRPDCEVGTKGVEIVGVRVPHPAAKSLSRDWSWMEWLIWAESRASGTSLASASFRPRPLSAASTGKTPSPNRSGPRPAP